MEIERDAFVSASSPLIAEVPDTPGNWNDSDGGLVITVPVRNIGAGPAFIRKAMLSGSTGFLFETTIDHRIIPVNEIATIRVGVAADMPGKRDLAALDEVEVALSYSDIGASRRRQTVLKMSFGGRTTYQEGTGLAHSQRGRVRDVELYGCDENWTRADEPWVRTGED